MREWKKIIHEADFFVPDLRFRARIHPSPGGNKDLWTNGKLTVPFGKTGLRARKISGYKSH